MKKTLFAVVLILISLQAMAFKLPEQLVQQGVSVDMIVNTLPSREAVDYRFVNVVRPKWGVGADYLVLALQGTMIEGKEADDDGIGLDPVGWLFLKKSGGKWEIVLQEWSYERNEDTYLVNVTGKNSDDVVLCSGTGNHGAMFTIYSFIDGKIKNTFTGDAYGYSYSVDENGIQICRYALIVACEVCQIYRPENYTWNGKEFIKAPYPFMDLMDEYDQNQKRMFRKSWLKKFVKKYEPFMIADLDGFLSAYNAATIAYGGIGNKKLGKLYYEKAKEIADEIKWEDNYTTPKDKIKGPLKMPKGLKDKTAIAQMQAMINQANENAPQKEDDCGRSGNIRELVEKVKAGNPWE